jgi:hypothetical protein
MLVVALEEEIAALQATRTGDRAEFVDQGVHQFAPRPETDRKARRVRDRFATLGV